MTSWIHSVTGKKPSFCLNQRRNSTQGMKEQKTESVKMTNPMSNPTPMCIIMPTTVSEEMNNTTIAVASPCDTGTTS